jgi:hypothetical protein
MSSIWLVLPLVAILIGTLVVLALDWLDEWSREQTFRDLERLDEMKDEDWRWPAR